MNDSEKDLPFDEKGQRAVIGHLFTDREFAFKCSELLGSDCFASEKLAKLYEMFFDFYKINKSIPTKEELINEIHLSDFLDDLDKDQYKRLLNDCVAQSTCMQVSYLRSKMTRWLQVGEYRRTFTQFKESYKKHDIDKVYDIMQSCVKKVRDLDFNRDGQYVFGDYASDIKALEKEQEGVITTGIPLLDAALGGGLRRKEHTVIAAPLNTGKTSICINIAKANIDQEKTVLFLTHEMNPLDISVKMKQCYGKLTKEDYVNLPKTTAGINQLILMEKILKDQLCYYPYNKAGGIYIEDVIDIVRRKNEELFSRTGKYYDLLIDDYPAKLSSREFKNSKDKRHSLAYIYEQFQQLALEFNMHAISPVQINRSGVKRNQERKDDEDFIKGADVAEAHQILQDASNVFVLNRSTEDEKKNRMFIYIDKSRSSEKNFAVKLNTDFTKCLLIDPQLGQSLIQEGSSRSNSDDDRENLVQYLGKMTKEAK